jgi:DNA-binding LytR/AlgR family response regulator
MKTLSLREWKGQELFYGPIIFPLYSKKGIVRCVLRPSDIVYLEAKGSYTKIITHDKSSVLVSKNLKLVLSQLTESGLNIIRIHNSYAVNKDFLLSKTSGYVYTTTDDELKIGSKYKCSIKSLLPSL